MNKKYASNDAQTHSLIKSEMHIQRHHGSWDFSLEDIFRPNLPEHARLRMNQTYQSGVG